MRLRVWDCFRQLSGLLVAKILNPKVTINILLNNVVMSALFYFHAIAKLSTFFFKKIVFNDQINFPVWGEFLLLTYCT